MRARRSPLRAMLLASLLAVVGACGPDGEAAPAARAGAVAPGGPAPTGAFPVTIEHKYGSTTIPAEPQRVVSIGYQEHDSILALGVVPVAVRYWYGPQDDVIYPWAEDAAAGADPEILVMPELNFEAVAAQRPDLILGVYSGITEEEYATLSAIAPTVPQTAAYVDYGVPWQDMTRTAGRALGRSDRAEQLVADLEARFAAVRSRHPQFVGRSVVVATYGADNVGFFASDDPRSRFFRSLGFEVPDEFDQLAGDEFFGTFSFERIPDLLDRDLLVWDQVSFTPQGRATIDGDALVAGLAVTRDGRSLVLEGELEAAFGWNTVLSLPLVLDRIEPMLAAAFPPAT